MSAKSSIKKRKIIRYFVVLASAIVVRVLFALFTSIAVQKYAGLIIIVAAIAVFFTWDYLDQKHRQY